MNRIVIGVGEILWDVFPDRKVLGGAPANFAYHASQLGCEGYALSAIGRDAQGKEITESLANKSLRTLLAETDFPTGTVQVTLNAKGVPQYEICEGVAWDNIPLTPQAEALAQQAGAVCFGSLAQRSAMSRSTIQRLLDMAPRGALRVFDINLRQHFYSREIIEASLARCNVLKINDDEVAIVAQLYGFAATDEQAVCRRLLHDYGLQMVIETKGAVGSYIFGEAETSYMDTPRVAVADTVGAGDSFTGALVAALLHGKSVAEAHRLAVDVSAFVCTQHGAMPEYNSQLRI